MVNGTKRYSLYVLEIAAKKRSHIACVSSKPFDPFDSAQDSEAQSALP